MLIGTPIFFCSIYSNSDPVALNEIPRIVEFSNDREKRKIEVEKNKN